MHCPNVTSIVVPSGCSSSTCNHIFEAWPRLQSLNISLPIASDQCMAMVAAHCKNLTSVDVGGTLLSADTWKTFLQCCGPTLRELIGVSVLIQNGSRLICAIHCSSLWKLDINEESVGSGGAIIRAAWCQLARSCQALKNVTIYTLASADRVSSWLSLMGNRLVCLK